MDRLKTLLLSLSIIMGSVLAWAHDFSAVLDGQILYFKILNKANPTVALTYKGKIADKDRINIAGIVEIPSKVKHDNVTYTVTEIGAKTFCGDTALVGVVMPSTITKIGDFAFEGCTNLSKVVFPGSTVKFGQGTFFNCTSIKDLSFGSDWESLDLAAYRWSDSLTTINIPAKITRIQNLKSLPYLQKVIVDANNANFTSYDGCLYNKKGTVLYAVPRAYSGTLVIRNTTEKVTKGALIDCTLITRIIVPASVTSMSFRETSRMSGLTEIVFKGATPIVTGYKDGTGMLVLQLANNTAKITVAATAKKDYTAQLASEAGEYTESTDATSIPYMISNNELPNAKSITDVKNIEKYE